MMDRKEIRALTDEDISDLIKQLKKEQQHRVDTLRAKWRSELNDYISHALEMVDRLADMDVHVSLEIEGDGNDRIVDLTAFASNPDAGVNVVLRPVLKGD